MDIVTLARFQFAMTTIYHFFFVPFTIGTTIVVAIMETTYVVTKKKVYREMAQFWGKIMLLSFAVGVVTGIIQEFQFGMNWSDFSRFVGDIFGAPLAVEALLAFFMESTFLGLWISTWDRVSPKLHVVFIWLVSLGSILSAIWILMANGFMQHPVGYKIVNGHAHLVNFVDVITNPQAWFEILHILTAAFAMGGIIVAGLAAFRMLKANQLSENARLIYKKSIKLGLIVTLIGSIAVIMAGDSQMQYLIHEQPMKFAATEGVYNTTGKRAPWAVIAIPDEKAHKNKFEIDIPDMLSILSYHKTTGAVTGMNETNKKLVKKYGDNKDYYPPVSTLFYSFRIMAAFGTVMLGVSFLGLIFIRKKNPILYKHKWMLWILGLSLFSPFLANTAGWLITEMGRDPWTVYGLFTIKQSVSPNVSATSLLISNIVYFLLFTFLALAMIGLVVRVMKKGPEPEESTGYIDDKGGAF